MRKTIGTCAVVLAFTALASPASANHGEIPHDCFGQYHSGAAQALGGLGEIARMWAQQPEARPDQTEQPFGLFVENRAHNCP
jgi:hypothetical protein